MALSGRHYHEAELILDSDPCEYGCPHSGCEHEMRLIARAQAHATLAAVHAHNRATTELTGLLRAMADQAQEAREAAQ